MKKVIAVIIFFFILIVQCKKDKAVISNPGYAIGVIDFYKPFNTNSSDISFVYSVGGKQYGTGYSNGNNGWSVPSSGTYNSGDKYMVQYDINNPKTCRFLFDYPVHDSTDYLNDVSQFKTHPPSCCLILPLFKI
jgi:hypothetical protein